MIVGPSAQIKHRISHCVFKCEVSSSSKSFQENGGKRNGNYWTGIDGSENMRKDLNNYSMSPAGLTDI